MQSPTNGFIWSLLHFQASVYIVMYRAETNLGRTEVAFKVLLSHPVIQQPSPLPNAEPLHSHEHFHQYYFSR